MCSQAIVNIGAVLPELRLIGSARLDVRQYLNLAFPYRLAERDRMMLVLHGYFDESGTHDTSKAVCIAGYISTAEQWALFNDEWHAALDQWGLEFFHMTDFATRAKLYSEWGEDVCRARYWRLASIIKKHTLVSFAIGFMRDAYDSILDRKTKRFVGGPYAAAAAMVFMDAAKQLNPLYPSARIAYVFESGGRGYGEVLSTFELNEAIPENRKEFKLLSAPF